jgi:hypothetical protein
VTHTKSPSEHAVMNQSLKVCISLSCSMFIQFCYYVSERMKVPLKEYFSSIYQRIDENSNPTKYRGSPIRCKWLQLMFYLTQLLWKKFSIQDCRRRNMLYTVMLESFWSRQIALYVCILNRQKVFRKAHLSPFLYFFCAYSSFLLPVLSLFQLSHHNQQKLEV